MCITYYVALLKYLRTTCLFSCLNVLNKALKILYVNGLSPMYRYNLTATYSRTTQFYFLDCICYEYTTDTLFTIDASTQSATRCKVKIIFIHVPNLLYFVNIFESAACAASEP